MEILPDTSIKEVDYWAIGPKEGTSWIFTRRTIRAGSKRKGKTPNTTTQIPI
jgi:hypothetical protein